MGRDTVVCGFDCQAACAVEYQVILGEDDCVCVCVTVCCECACNLQCVIACCCDKYLVSVLDVDDRCVCVCDVCAVENDLDLVLITCFNCDRYFFRCSLDHIDTGFGNRNILIVCDRIGDCLRQVSCLGIVTVSEQGRSVSDQCAGCCLDCDCVLCV